MGDPACWMAYVCADCGAFLGDGHEGPCPRCGSTALAVADADGPSLSSGAAAPTSPPEPRADP